MTHRHLTHLALTMLLLVPAGCVAVDDEPAMLEDRSATPPEHEQQGKARRLANPAAHKQQMQGQVLRRPLPSPTAPGFDSERLWSVENDWEPTVAVDPSGSVIYQLTTRYGPSGVGPGGPDPAVMFRRSLDGGASWEDDRLLDVVPGTQNDPELVAAAGGIVYAAWLHVWEIKVVRSSDRGVSWSAPVSVLAQGAPPNWSDKPALTASADGRDVYVAFNASDSYVVASHDFGQTFSAPVRTNNDARYWFHTGGAVAPDGSVYFAATDYSQTYAGPARLRVIRSLDGGVSWTTSLVQTSQELPPCGWSPSCPFGFMGPSVGIAVDSTGLVMVAYNASDTASAPQQLYVKTSTDGATWSARVEIGSLAGGVNHAFPALCIGPMPGDFRVVWQDDRQGTSRWNTWYCRTTDGGTSWSQDVRLSDLQRGATYKSQEGYAFPYGDYIGLAVTPDGTNHVLWGEGTGYLGPGGSWYTRGD